MMNDADSAEALQSDLEALGFMSTATWSTSSGRQQLRRGLPPAIILDDRLTRMKPLEYVRELRSSAGHHLPVIILSSIRYTKARMESMRMEIGLGDVICKPFSLIDLVRMLRKFCDPKRPASVSSVTDYTNPTEVFFVLMGQAIRAERPMALVRERADEAVHIFLEGARLLAVTSSDPHVRGLEEILMAEGLASSGEVKAARRQMDTASNDRKLGEILVASQAVSVKDLNKCLQLQARLRFVDLFGWRSGTIRLLPNESPPAWSARVNLDIHPLVMRSLKQSGDQRVLNQLVENLFQKKLSLPRDLPKNFRALADSPQQKSFLKFLDKGRTMAQAIRLSRIDQDSARIWVAYLVFVLGAKPREKAMASTMATLHQLRLRKMGASPSLTSKRPRRSEADQAFALGWKMMTNELFESAVPSLRRALDLEPKRSKTLACLGWCLFKLEKNPRVGSARRAMEMIQDAVAEKPDLVIGHVFLGHIHRDLGDPDRAREAFMKALEEDPGNSEAMAELRQLHQQPWAKEGPKAPAPSEKKPPTMTKEHAGLPGSPRPPARKKEPPPVAAPLSPAPPEEAPAEKPEAGQARPKKEMPPLATPLDAGPAEAFGPDDATPLSRDGGRERRRPETPETQPVVPIPFSLIVLEWDAVNTGDGSGSAVLLDSQTKADMVHEVRSFGASLEEFSLSRLCVVVGIPKPVDDHRTQAAELALELVNVMRRADDKSGSTRELTVRGAIACGVATPSDSGATVGEAVAQGRRLVGLADSWQVVAETPLYKGFQNMVLTKPLNRRPNMVEVCECLVKSRVMPGVASAQPMQASLSSAAFPVALKDSVGTSAGFESLSLGGGDGVIGPGSMVETFQIQRLVGSGGMGEVYLAVDVSLGRPVALKMIRPELLTRPTALRRFKREAQALAKINSQNVTHIYALSLESNPPYLVMEYVDGASIHYLLKEDGTFDSKETARMALQVVAGLQAVYLEGLTHRDINPKNLLLNKSGNVKITDFGLVQMELTGSSMSMTHSIVGTPSYMSPEQARGETVDFRTDLYSLGMTLFHMMVGKPPFTGETIAEILSKHIMEPVPSIRSFRPDAAVLLDELVQWLTAKKINDRPQSYDAVASALRAILPD